MSRREGLWAAGAAATQRPDRLPGVGSSSHIPSLPGMSELELSAADVWATGISPDSYPTQFLRDDLDAMGVVPAEKLLSVGETPVPKEIPAPELASWTSIARAILNLSETVTRE